MIDLRPSVKIIRLEEHESYGTFGVMLIDGQVFCSTLELPDRLNMMNVSSIPAKQYLCKLTNSPKFNQTYQVMDVPGRTNILFHPGNTVDDTAGCILIGQYPAKFRLPVEHRGLANSGATHINFMRIMAGVNRFHLTIKEEY